MCGIIASFDLDKFKELILLNQKRGSFSYSFTMYNKITKEVNIFKDFGPFDFKVFPKSKNPNIYYIGHIQAPTGGLIEDKERIHPSVYNNTYLYHNGILKDYIINKLKGDNTNWDTFLLHNVLFQNRQDLSNIDGSFGCLYINKDIYVFRNELIPLFIDDEFNISSSKFEKSILIMPNIIYRLNFEEENLHCVDVFKTFNSPYYLGDHLWTTP